jgi:stage V sporulation protein R
MALSRTLTPELRAHAQRIEGVAHKSGLDFFPVVFEMLDAKDVNGVAAYGGFPVRYPSWRFGMDFERLDKGYSWGLSKIYELVINNDPTYAYLVRTNSDMEQKLVMAHVFGHADFFKHNVWFSPTNRHMLDSMANHGTRLRRYIDRYGQDTVELFLDRALSLDNLVDPYLPLRGRLQGAGNSRDPVSAVERARRSFEAAFDEECEAPTGEENVADDEATQSGSPMLPTYDILGFIAERGPLTRWQRDVMRIARAEAYYFMPQRMTKIINEGWASFWHSRILTGGVLAPSEIIDFADCHSGATLVQPGQLNPYKLGIELFRHAEEIGLDIFRLRRVHNDTSFVDEVFDEEFAKKNQLFVYGRNHRTGRTEVLDRDWMEVKEKLLQSLAWGGLPQIELVDDDFEGREELHLVHHHDGRDLDLRAAGDTLRQVALLWGRPAHLSTTEEGQGRRLTTDGNEIKAIDTSASEETPSEEEGPAKEAS